MSGKPPSVGRICLASFNFTLIVHLFYFEWSVGLSVHNNCFVVNQKTRFEVSSIGLSTATDLKPSTVFLA